MTYLDHGVISVRHWTRLRDGALYAATHRLDWATLLRRTFDIDVLRCPSCPGRMRPRAELSDPSAIALVMESLGLAPDSPPIARARDPTELLGDDLPDSAD